MTPTTRMLLAALAALAVIAGCGGDEETTSSQEPPPAAEGTTSTAEAPQVPTTEGNSEPTLDELKAAGVQLASGATNGAALDTRTGIVPDITAPPEATLEELAQSAGCDLQIDLPDEGNQHLGAGAPAPAYGTSPPTSGGHSSTPQADGAYLEAPPDVNVVHALEHGRVAIQYAPDIDEDAQLHLKGVFDEKAPGTLLFPNPSFDGAIAATAWTRLIVCPESDVESILAIRAFRDEFRGKGPEAVPLLVG